MEVQRKFHKSSREGRSVRDTATEQHINDTECFKRLVVRSGQKRDSVRSTTNQYVYFNRIMACFCIKTAH